MYFLPLLRLSIFLSKKYGYLIVHQPVRRLFLLCVLFALQTDESKELNHIDGLSV